MKHVLAVSLLVSALASAQTLTLTGPAKARPGQTISVQVVLASPPADLAATQWDATLPAGYTAAAVAGAATTAAAKTLYCNADSTRCLTVGINANLYAAGVVATYALKIPALAAPGPVTIPFCCAIGAQLSGNAAVLSAGVPYTFTVLRNADLNEDGAVDLLDLQMMIQEILAGPVVHDPNGDGNANVYDAQAVARAAGGG